LLELRRSHRVASTKSKGVAVAAHDDDDDEEEDNKDDNVVDSEQEDDDGRANNDEEDDGDDDEDSGGDDSSSEYDSSSDEDTDTDNVGSKNSDEEATPSDAAAHGKAPDLPATPVSSQQNIDDECDTPILELLAADSEKSDYEKMRDEKIKRNMKRLKELGLDNVSLSQLSKGTGTCIIVYFCYFIYMSHYYNYSPFFFLV
jgi:hypothetical protein